jgi:methionyl aminopeptidase
MVEMKTAGEIDAIHAAGQVVAGILATARTAATPGTRLSELDEAARGVLADARATSPFLAYQPNWARAAHVEHTIAVTPDGPRILTAAPA